MEMEMDTVEKPSVQQQPDSDADDEFSYTEQRKIIHKVDRRLLIIAGLMQAVSFLDRANMSNAAVAGLTAELNMEVGNRYSITLLVFFAPYIIFEFPATIAVRKIGPRKFLSTIVFLWGIIMICFGFVQTWVSLIPLRMLLGAFEAGSFPGMYYLVSSWYSRFDLYKRISIFYLIGVFGSAASGVLALGFSRMDGLANYAGWRWIFIMEGILTCLIGILGYVFMVSFPSQSHTVRGFLTPAESAYILRRLDRDRGDADIAGEKFNWRAFFSAALDIKVWGFALAFLCSTMQAYSIGFFLPVLLKQKMSFSEAASQALSSPPYLAAMALMYVEGLVSDKLRLRSPMLYLNCLLSIIGLSLMEWASTPGVQYLGAILVCAGCSANIPSLMVFQANNIRGQWKRAFCSASLISFGGTGGIVGSLVFRAQDKPMYLPGIVACLTANGVIVVIVTCLVVLFALRNRQAERGVAVIEGLQSFRYVL
ncbi:major facilitator superfamily domain-containing protein [Aspergillus keveii]|uniref:Major facilitator superfamily domain-containing protein n=1 Tax=Aspergillus keveii TaxID=714993 RepID=A0ABR4FHL7_9EURO